MSVPAHGGQRTNCRSQFSSFIMGDQGIELTQVIRPSGKCLYHLSHLVSQCFILWFQKCWQWSVSIDAGEEKGIKDPWSPWNENPAEMADEVIGWTSKGANSDLW